MVRKGSLNNQNESIQRSDAGLIECKTPKIVLERLNIPLDSVVLVRGDTITYPLDSVTSQTNQVTNAIDVSNSDENNGTIDDEDFQEMIIKRFHATHSNKINLSKVTRNDAESQQSTSLLSSNFSNKVIGGENSQKIFESKSICSQGKFTQMSDNSGRIKKYEAYKKHIQMKITKRNMGETDGSDENVQLSVGSDSIKNSDTITINKSVTVKLTNSEVESNVFENSAVEEETSMTEDIGKIVDSKGKNSSNIYDDSLSEDEISQKLNENDSTKQDDDQNRDNDFTPSRVSQRIKNKKVKFSALKLLAGGNLNLLRKELRLSSNKKLTPKKLALKTNFLNSADINANNSQIPMTVVKETTTKGSSTNLIKSKISSDVHKNYKDGQVIPLTSKESSRFVDIVEKEVSNNDIEPYEKNNTEENQNQKEKRNDSSHVVESKSSKSLPESQLLESSTVHNVVKSRNNKVRLHLQDMSPRKIVNITITPGKNQDLHKSDLKQNFDVALGPDIIIRRVRSDKKPEAEKSSKDAQDNNSSKQGDKNSSDSNKGDGAGQSSSEENVTKDKNDSVQKFISSVTKPITKADKEVEVPPQIKKFLLENTKNMKTITFKPGESLLNRINALSNNNSVRREKEKEEMRKKVSKNLKKKKRLLRIKNKGMNKKKIFKKRRTSFRDGESEDDDDDDDEIREDCSVITIQDEESSENADISIGISKNNLNDTSVGFNKNKEIISPSTNSKDTEKKTAKVTPLRQVNKIQPRSDLIKTTNSEDLTQYSKSKKVPRVGAPGELSILGGKRNYRNTFEKYFISAEKICEHNDSLDSDSSDEVEVLSHFIDLSKRNRLQEDPLNIENTEEAMNQFENSIENINATNISTTLATAFENEQNISGTCQEKGTVNDIIKGIIADLPRWNLYALPESAAICLINLHKEAGGIVDVKKCIEIDCNFKVNVYVNKTLVNEYCGVYDSFDAIKNLIYQLDLL